MSYARYKFNKAVRSLEQAGKLRSAWLMSEHMQRLMRLTPQDVPKELAAEFRLLQREVKPIVGAVEFDNMPWRTTHTVDEETAVRIVERIRQMHQKIESNWERQHSLPQSEVDKISDL